MAKILHFVEDDGYREYIVITENETEEAFEEHRIRGYSLNKAYDIEEVGILPTDRCLHPTGFGDPTLLR